VPNNYPPEFRQQMVELVRAGRTAEELAKEFQPSAQSIRTWVRQADLDDGRRQDGLTSAEKDELARLRREVKILREEKEILRKAAVFFARETDLPRVASTGVVYEFGLVTGVAS
jgi:transposase